MDTEERVKQAIEMFRREGPTQEFVLYFQKLKGEDPLAYSVVEIYTHNIRKQFPLSIRKGVSLLHRVSDRPGLAQWLFLLIGTAYRGVGEMEAGEACFLRALDMARLTGDSENISRAKLQICISRFFKAEYEQAYKDFWSYRKDPGSRTPYMADYFLGILAIIRGQPTEAIRSLDRSLEVSLKTPNRFGALEMKALALRILGKLSEAMETLLESAIGYIDYESTYSAFPLAKALELSRLAGLEPPPRKLIRKALSLAKRGSWGEQAAAQEIEALLREDDAEAAEGLTRPLRTT